MGIISILLKNLDKKANDSKEKAIKESLKSENKGKIIFYLNL